MLEANDLPCVAPFEEIDESRWPSKLVDLVPAELRGDLTKELMGGGTTVHVYVSATGAEDAPTREDVEHPRYAQGRAGEQGRPEDRRCAVCADVQADAQTATGECEDDDTPEYLVQERQGLRNRARPRGQETGPALARPA